MLRVICVRTGDKFIPWYEDNLKYMIDKYSGLEYDKFEVIRDDEYEGVFNKLQMFDRYRDGQNIYFDLDVIIKGNVTNFLRKDLTVCHAWWREAYHTPLNSSIISWEGDRSDVFEKFEDDPEYWMMKYQFGMDQYLFEQITDLQTYNENDGYCSYQTVTAEEDYSVYLFNQRYQNLLEDGWHGKFCMPLP